MNKIRNERIRRASGHERVRSGASFFFLRFIEFFDNWPPPWEPRASKSSLGEYSELNRSVLFRPWTLHGSIWVDFWTTKERAKNQRFFDPLQIDPRRSKNRPKVGQGPIFHGFSMTFGPPFFMLFGDTPKSHN